MAHRLDGKLMLVTGGAAGIGAAMSRRFSAEGARVAVADIDLEAAVRLAAEIDGVAIGLDVADADAWAPAVEIVQQSFGGLHVLVNNAGICLTGNVEGISFDDWDRTHKVDLDSVFHGTRACLPLIRATIAGGGYGSILNISSISAMVAASSMAAYNSAKAAVRHLSKSIALHCAKVDRRITCNSLHPTFVETGLLDGFAGGRSRAETIDRLARQVPVGRIGRPDDVAWAAVYLCSDEASFVTGAELAVDGGLSAG